MARYSDNLNAEGLQLVAYRPSHMSIADDNGLSSRDRTAFVRKPRPRPLAFMTLDGEKSARPRKDKRRDRLRDYRSMEMSKMDFYTVGTSLRQKFSSSSRRRQHFETLRRLEPLGFEIPDDGMRCQRQLAKKRAFAPNMHHLASVRHKRFQMRNVRRLRSKALLRPLQPDKISVFHSYSSSAPL